jgi:hypothetical protein
MIKRGGFRCSIYSSLQVPLARLTSIISFLSLCRLMIARLTGSVVPLVKASTRISGGAFPYLRRDVSRLRGLHGRMFRPRGHTAARPGLT